MTLYEKDFYGWAMEQADRLRKGDLGALDAAHLAEEIADVGRGEQRRLENHLTVLLQHLLKWQYQPDRRSRSWALTIKEQRRQVAKVLRKNPSLQAALDESLADAYEDAVLRAERETGLLESTFPAACPWGFDDVTDEAFLPE